MSARWTEAVTSTTGICAKSCRCLSTSRSCIPLNPGIDTSVNTAAGSWLLDLGQSRIAVSNDLDHVRQRSSGNSDQLLDHGVILTKDYRPHAGLPSSDGRTGTVT
jgi:hypothetical protein